MNQFKHEIHRKVDSLGNRLMRRLLENPLRCTFFLMIAGPRSSRSKAKLFGSPSVALTLNRGLLVLVVSLNSLTTTNLRQLPSTMMELLFPMLLSEGCTTILQLPLMSQKMCS